jgi:hypothetical protein
LKEFRELIITSRAPHRILPAMVALVLFSPTVSIPGEPDDLNPLPLAVGLFFVLPAASMVSAGSSGTPAAVNWTTANPLAVRGQIVQLALYERLLIHVGLVDQSVSAGIIGEVGPESFALNSDSSSQSISIPFTLLRSIRWIEPDKSPRAFKIKQVARELHNTPSIIARVELRNRQVLSGRIGDASDLSFALVAPDTGAEQFIDYREVSQLSGAN